MTSSNGPDIPGIRRLSRLTLARGRAVLVGVGLILVGAGAVAVFVSTNAAGTAALIGAGTVLVVVGALSDRIDSIEGGGVKLHLVKALQETREAADAAQRSGQVEQASQLRDQAEMLSRAIDDISSEFDTIRATMPSSWEKTVRQEDLVKQAKGIAGAVSGVRQVEERFHNGSPGQRVTALSWIQEEPERLKSVRVVVRAILDHRSAFEQYHALKAAEQLALYGSLDGAELHELREAVVELLSSGQVRRGGDRGQLAERVLLLLDRYESEANLI